MNQPVVLASGALLETPFLDVLMDACSREEPTIVEVVRDSGGRSFWFRDGELVALTSSSRSESLSSMLVKRKKLQESVAVSIDEVATKDGITPAQVMLRDRVLPIPDLVREISLWATLLLVETFGWTDADWRICADPPGNAPPETLLELNLVGALKKGVFKRLSVDDVRAMMRPHHGARPRKTQPPPRTIVGYDLDGYQHAFWEAIDGGRTVAEILEFSTIPGEDAVRLLYLLHRTGMITFADRGAVAPPAPAMAVDDVWATPTSPEVDSDEFDPAPAAPPPSPAAAASGIDMSQIRFHRKASTDSDESESSGTFHAVAPHTREEVARAGTGGWKKVEVGIGHAEEVTSADEPSPAGRAGLDSLFDGLGIPSGDNLAVASPRPGARQPLQKPPPSSAAVPPVPPKVDANAPPGGRGPVIEQEDWDRLTTKDKDRIRVMRRELNKMAETNYFEWFGLSHESPVASIKKAYFQMAKMYHPDSLLDETEVYRTMAESLFANFSEAYETLSDDEARDSYTRKHIFGEKDENDLAMEKVQKILAAENAFKKGLRALDRGGLKEALRHFKEALEGYEDEAEYVAYYGYVLFRSRLSADPEGADEGIEMMKRATRMKEMAPKPWHLLGKAYLYRSEPKTAKAMLRRALKLQPDAPEVQRDYKRANDLDKGGAAPASGGGSEGSKKSIFGSLFGKKKAASKPSDDDDGLDF